MNSKNIKFITLTAIFIALLVVCQSISKAFGQYVTGSLVNFVLIAAALLSGWKSGAIVALVSPFVAFMLGIGTPFIQLVPFIAIGNLVIVTVYAFVMNFKFDIRVRWAIAGVLGAVLKFATIYFSIVKAILPTMHLKPKQLKMLSATFSYPQLVTALIGGIIAALAIPLVSKALRKSKTAEK